MRCAVLVGLVAFWLIAIGMHAHGQRSRPAAAAHAAGRNQAPAPARGKSAKPKPTATKSEPVQSWIVYSQPRFTREDALEDALDTARDEVLIKLNGLTHTDRGEPLMDVKKYVRDRLWTDLSPSDVDLQFKDTKAEVAGYPIDGRRVVVESHKHPDAEDEKQRETFRIALRVSVTPEIRADLMQQIRNQRMGDRMLGLGKVLGVLVVLLGGVAGYLRLDEWTKGYYTTWLRLGVIGLIGIAGMGYWLLP